VEARSAADSLAAAAALAQMPSLTGDRKQIGQLPFALQTCTLVGELSVVTRMWSLPSAPLSSSRACTVSKDRRHLYNPLLQKALISVVSKQRGFRFVFLAKNIKIG
jgi:hypothetical protein